MQVGGTELNAIRTAELLDRSRFDLRVVSLQDHGPLLERYAAAGVPVHPLPLKSLYRPSVLRRGAALVRLLRKHRVEIVHAHDIYSNLFAVPWARLAGARTLASRRWWEGSPGMAWRLASRRAYGMAHAVLANSDAIGRLVTDREGVSPDHVFVVPNFVDAEMFTPPPADAVRALRSELGIPSGVPVIGIVANLLPIKNHALLLRAAAVLREQDLAFHLVMVGDGPERGRLEQLADQLDLRAAVTFAGRLPNRPNLHHLFDISVLSSDSEGMPNTVLEAMAAARPVVSTRVGAVADAVVHGESGLLVEPGDVSGLASALSWLIRSPADASRLGAAAYDVAFTRHSPRAALGRLEHLYETLAGRSAPARAPIGHPALVPAGG